MVSEMSDRNWLFVEVSPLGNRKTNILYKEFIKSVKNDNHLM